MVDAVVDWGWREAPTRGRRLGWWEGKADSGREMTAATSPLLPPFTRPDRISKTGFHLNTGGTCTVYFDTVIPQNKGETRYLTTITYASHYY